MGKFCSVILFSYSFDSQGITFSVPKEIDVKKGDIVEISVAHKSPELGIVIESYNVEEFPSPYEIKDIIRVIETISLDKVQIEMIQRISKYYFCALHTSAQLFFPTHLLKTLQKGKLKLPTGEKNITLDTAQLSSLNSQQTKIIDEILSSKNKKILLWGVTGSGKTEIYTHLAYNFLKQGKQVLILSPEIILGGQLAQRCIKVFGKENTREIHSAVPDAQKTKAWCEIYSQIPKIIIGTRSSIFYPYRNLGSIIIDEEHDRSYSSESGARYNTKEVCEFLSEKLDIPLLLGSGTPSVKTMYEAQKGKYQLLQLFEKFENSRG